MRSLPFAPLLLLPIFVGACHDGLDVPDGNGDLGACAAATSEASCNAMPACVVDVCPCGRDGKTFIGCYPQGTHFSPCSTLLSCVSTCAEIGDATSCDARSDCYAEYSGDLPCNSSGCSNHFVACQQGPAVCTLPGAECEGACAKLVPACPSGLRAASPDAEQTCCTDRCVTATKCLSPDG